MHFLTHVQDPKAGEGVVSAGWETLKKREKSNGGRCLSLTPSLLFTLIAEAPLLRTAVERFAAAGMCHLHPVIQ